MMDEDVGKLVKGKGNPGVVLPDLIEWIANESRAFATEGATFSARHVRGDPRLTIVAGGNASGKSLFHRFVRQICGRNDIEAGTISIRERTGAGETPGSMRRMFMYGDEATQSTGASSVKVVQKLFDYATRDHTPVCVLLDEPEMGLSDGYAHAFGTLIGERASMVSPAMCGTMVISHSRTLIRGAISGLGAEPGYVAMMDAPSTLGEWLDQQEEHSIDDLLSLGDTALKRFLEVRDLLKR